MSNTMSEIITNINEESKALIAQIVFKEITKDPKLIERTVHEIFKKDGYARKSSFGGLVQNIVKEHVRQAIENIVTSQMPEIEQLVRKELSSEQMVSGVIGTMLNGLKDNFRIRISMEVPESHSKKKTDQGLYDNLDGEVEDEDDEE